MFSQGREVWDYSTAPEGPAFQSPQILRKGGGRKSSSEFRRYLFIALGSLKEAETQILISDALGFFKPNTATKLLEMAAEVGAY